MPWIAGIEFVASAKRLYGLGDKGETENASFRYVQADGAVSESAALRWGSDYDAAPLDVDNDDIGAEVGIATVAAADDQYLWALVAGKTQALSMADANTTLQAAATTNAGYVDDSGSGLTISGMVTTEDAGAMGSLVEAVLTYPTLQAAGGGGTGTLNVTTETMKIRRFGTTYEVAGTVLEDDASNSNAHGLGAVPDGLEAYLECTTADKSYAVGDKVHLVQPPPWRETIWYDDTNVYVLTKNQGWGIISKGSTSGDSGNFDLSDWKLVIRPYVYEDKTVVTGVTLV